MVFLPQAAISTKRSNTFESVAQLIETISRFQKNGGKTSPAKAEFHPLPIATIQAICRVQARIVFLLRMRMN